MEEFIILKYENLFLLCSESINSGDKIIFINKKKQLLSGKIDKIEKKDLVRVVSYNESDVSNFNYVYYVDSKKCFYPIFEIFESLEDDFHMKRITRDKVSFKTICNKCHIDSKDFESCDRLDHNCKKEKKSYASISI